MYRARPGTPQLKNFPFSRIFCRINGGRNAAKMPRASANTHGEAIAVVSEEMRSRPHLTSGQSILCDIAIETAKCLITNDSETVAHAVPYTVLRDFETALRQMRYVYGPHNDIPEIAHLDRITIAGKTYRTWADLADALRPKLIEVAKLHVKTHLTTKGFAK